MASNALSTDSCSTSESGWDDSQILSSLDRLQEMHLQLRHLRDTVPRIVKPLLVQQPTPGALHENFMQTAIKAVKDLNDFAKILESEKTRDLLELAKKNRTKHPEGITGWMVTQHEDWLDVQEKGPLIISVSEGTETLTAEGVYNEETTRKILDNFQNSHIGIETSFINNDFKNIKVNLPAPANIEFEIEIKDDIQESIPLNVTCNGKSNLHKAILNAVLARAKSKDLVYLLEMLASYDGIKSSPCFKCMRLLDPNAQLPVTRLKETIKLANGESSTVWKALHKGCS